MKGIVVAPSILAADLGRLGEEVSAVDRLDPHRHHGRQVLAEHLLRARGRRGRRVLAHIREFGKKAGAVLDPVGRGGYREN
jgi:pentose-5-phosphate-3-epimerase